MAFIGLISCDNDSIDPVVFTQDEYPRVLGRWPSLKSDGTLGVFETPLNKTLSINVQYVPSSLCEGTWYIDGVEYYKGVGLKYVPSVMGEFNVKLVVQTETKQTTREAIIRVIEPIK